MTATSEVESPSADLRIGLLGPVTATRGGAPLPLGSRLQRGVLAVLATTPGAVLTSARLHEALWGDHPPATAAGTLRAYLSRLRTALGAAALPRVDGGYRLAVAPDAVDATAFGDAVGRAREQITTDPAGAGAVLADALALWRGDALADLADLPFAVAAGARLTAQRRQAECLLWRIRLGQGEHHAVLDELVAAADRAPDDEPVAALTMVALYRAGRQADALDRFAAVRSHLVGVLGIDPGPELRRVHEAVLSQAPWLLTGDPLADGGLPPGAVATSATVDGDLAGGDVTAPHVVPPEWAAAGAVAAPSTAAVLRPGGNLPTPLTSFVGRAAQLEVVARLLGTGRLLTLTGVGGVGKTRLAIEAVRRAGSHGDGPWVVELAGLTEAAMVPNAIAQALGVATTDEPLVALVEALAARSAVLVLDNCAHVVDAAATATAHLLRACPQLRIVATSREPLGVPGEQILVIPSLPSGSGEVAGEAELLFADRAALADPSFELDDRTRPLVESICRALDGIPLAIELAAGRLSALSLQQVVDLLDDRFGLLSEGSRVAVPRHRTLANAIGWSYALLDEDEREAMHAAAIFSGGFSLEALAAVAGTPLTRSATVLASLVDKSMVTTLDARGERRFRVLETIRQYCRTRIGEDAWAALADRHLDWAISIAREIAGRYLGDDAPWNLAALERDNLRSALAHAEATGDVAASIRICGDLSWSWFRLGQVAEGNRWLTRALEAVTDDVDRAELAQAYVGMSLGAYLSGDLPTAQDAIRGAVAAAEASGDVVLWALADGYLAYFEGAFGRVDVADQLLDAAEARAELPEWVLAELEMVRGQVRRAQGRVDEALATLERSRERAERWKHGYIHGSSGWIMAKTLLDVGRAAEAGPLLADTIRRLATQGDRSSTIAGLHTMAGIAGQLGRLYEGAVLLGAVDSLGARMGFHPARMDPIDGPRHRALIADGLPAPVLDRAKAEGAELSYREAIGLAVTVGETPGRVATAAARTR
ncbi:BTAD domain-containing putative transcriptional regulator [Euzebya sp.]|uniref:AfsR/SARP family transcriptional regulator n=1 Tax=Euzebya sp. TaxID=1971409 RepID=UPI00351810E1